MTFKFKTKHFIQPATSAIIAHNETDLKYSLMYHGANHITNLLNQSCMFMLLGHCL